MTNRKENVDIDDGWAWFVLVGLAFGLLLQASLMYAGGVIYVALLDTFHDDYTKTSLVGSINTGLLCLADRVIVPNQIIRAVQVRASTMKTLDFRTDRLNKPRSACYLGIVLSKVYKVAISSAHSFRAAITAIIVVQWLAVLAAAPLAGMITNKFSSRVAIVTGGAMATAGFTISSFAPSVDVILVAMGIIVGLAYSSMCCGMIVALGFYFQRWRNLVLSSCYVLVGVGMFTSAPFALYLIEIYGLRSTFLLMGGIIAQICVIGMICKPSSMEISFHKERHHDLRIQNRDNVILKKFPKKTSVSNVFNINVLRNIPFICFLISTSSWNFSLSVGIMHLPYYVSVKGGNADQIRLITTAFSVANIVGRVCGCFGVYKGIKHALIWYITSLGLAGVITSIFPLYSQYTVGNYVYCITLGLFCGVPNSMTTVIATDFVGASRLPEAYSFAYFFSGIGLTAGPVVAGFLYSLTGIYLYSFVLAGAILLLGSIVSLISVCIRKEETSESVAGSQTLAGIESCINGQTPLETESFLNGREMLNTSKN